MKTKTIRTLGLAILATLAAVASRGQSVASGAPGEGGGLCLARLTAPMSTAGPVCGSCAGQCRSDGLCKGKLAGDVCNASGGTCQVVGGCGMFDCCRCTNAFVALAPVAAIGALVTPMATSVARRSSEARRPPLTPAAAPREVIKQ